MEQFKIRIQFITNIIEEFDSDQVEFERGGWIRVKTAENSYTWYPEHQILHVKAIPNEHNDGGILQESDQNSSKVDEIPQSFDC